MAANTWQKVQQLSILMKSSPMTALYSSKSSHKTVGQLWAKKMVTAMNTHAKKLVIQTFPSAVSSFTSTGVTVNTILLPTEYWARK